ncbi:HAD family hydrolase, partial [Staphylococcus aureus]|uniref:HAD family hydrolase n=1 Tax=Staphylococcus aureus TaxID=1280 RepID=UPI001643103C
GVEEFLGDRNVRWLLDLMICREADGYEKGNGKVLWGLFEEYNVDGEKVGIVGESGNDMKRGSNGNLGMGIGVLRGIGR